MWSWPVNGLCLVVAAPLCKGPLIGPKHHPKKPAPDLIQGRILEKIRPHLWHVPGSDRRVGRFAAHAQDLDTIVVAKFLSDRGFRQVCLSLHETLSGMAELGRYPD